MRSIIVGVVMVLGFSVSFTGVGLAISQDAVRACHATQVQEGVGADVPESDRFEYFASVQADDGSAEELLCGDGRTWGAVHIEVKHRVENWGVARQCMTNVTSRAEGRPDGGKVTWVYSWAPGRSARVVAGNNGIVTSYPWDSGSEASWSACARS